MASVFFVAGAPLTRERRERALDSARELNARHPLAPMAGATSPAPQVLVVRVLAPVMEPAMDLLRTLRNTWRTALWNTAPSQPRIWAM